MARYTEGINGPVRGKVGTVIGSSWKGIPYIKSRGKARTKKVHKDEKANRDKFAEAQLWLRPLLDFVRQGFKGYTERVEGFVAAKSYLLRNAFEGVAPNRVIKPALVKVSFGRFPLPADITVGIVAPGRLQFTWDTKVADGLSADDQAMLLAYDIEHESAFYTMTGQFRKTGMDELVIAKKAGITYHIYFAFVAADRSQQSDSVYLGTVMT
jgi:hypothetical protein